MNLTERLQCIANEIKEGETMADIGTDHGFLPIYLLENNICPKAIMTDISHGSLAKAEENCKTFLRGSNHDLRLGNGIEVLKKGEVDVVCMAGMGGILMTEIMEEDMTKTCSIKKFILQPRSNIGYLRRWLYDNSFEIVNEQLVREQRFIWEILTVVKSTGKKDNKKQKMTGQGKANQSMMNEYNKPSIEFELPPSLARFANPLSLEFLEGKLKKEEAIRAEYTKAKNPEDVRIAEINYRISYIEELIESVKARVNQ
ncbi:MAG TPA: class I SAM-dependent methyltransferase [Anaerovoracaceae bacterium]|nr:class I SAM-dependent methyltransferase [Anaerovoracaceae bacterium]